jgi:hypothetical protein
MAGHQRKTQVTTLQLRRLAHDQPGTRRSAANSNENAGLQHHGLFYLNKNPKLRFSRFAFTTLMIV